MQIIALAFLASLAAAPAAPAPAGTPRAVVTNPSYQAGTVERGTKIEHAFAVRNEGNAPLTIEVTPHCGCTVAEADKIVAPGGTGSVKLIVDTTRFSGPITKSATLKTNDPAQASVQLTIAATVNAPLQALPQESISLSSVAPGSPRQTLTLRATSGAALEVAGIDAQGSFFRHEVTPGKDGAKELAVWLAPDAPKGMSRGTLTVRAKEPAGASLEIPVVARVE